MGALLEEANVGPDPRMPYVTVSVIKNDGTIQTNALQAVDELEDVFKEAGAISPPYDPSTLGLLFEHSNALRQNVDAYATNIDGFGHTYDPVVDLEADDTLDQVRAVMMLEEQAGRDDVQVPEPTDGEVDKRIKELANAQRMELLKLSSFFAHCSEVSFPRLRRITRQDIETTGNGFWEVVRNRGGKLAQFNYVPAWTVRLLPVDSTSTSVRYKVRTPALQFEEREGFRYFRRYVQKVNERCVYFKDYGDPRFVSAKTGKVYPTEAAFKAAEDEQGARLASEMIHFRIHSPRSAYGVPRWIGNLLSVLGSRQCEEVNFAYFENKSVPPLALLVSGGRLAKDSVQRLQDYIKNEIRGKDNFHKILVVESESPDGGLFENSGNTKIELKPLVEAQTSDALFQNYDERNIDKVGMAFRLPRMLRGDTRDFNRSTAGAALDFAERQVFEPERQDFDYYMNRWILPELGILHWLHKSNGPTLRDPEARAKMIHDLADFLTPNTALELSQDVFGRRFGRIEQEWGDKPLKVTLAEVSTMNNVAGGETGEAEDTNPDNNAPNTEPETTGAAGDNKGNQPRQAGGKFGTTAGKKRPKKKAVKKAAAVELLSSVADVLVEVREQAAAVAAEDAKARIARKRIKGAGM